MGLDYHPNGKKIMAQALAESVESAVIKDVLLESVWVHVKALDFAKLLPDLVTKCDTDAATNSRVNRNRDGTISTLRITGVSEAESKHSISWKSQSTTDSESESKAKAKAKASGSGSGSGGGGDAAGAASKANATQEPAEKSDKSGAQNAANESNSVPVYTALDTIQLSPITAKGHVFLQWTTSFDCESGNLPASLVKTCRKVKRSFVFHLRRLLQPFAPRPKVPATDADAGDQLFYNDLHQRYITSNPIQYILLFVLACFALRVA